MNNKEEHELRLKYLDVLLKNNISLENASKYIENIMEFDKIKKTAQEAEIQKLLNEEKAKKLGSDFNDETKELLMTNAGLSDDNNQLSFDFTSDIHLKNSAEELKKDLPSFNQQPPFSMVDPKGDKTVVDKDEKLKYGIQEKTSQNLGPSKEQMIPLRYEDRLRKLENFKKK